MADTLTITFPTPSTVITTGQTFVVSGTSQAAPITVMVDGVAVSVLSPAGETWQYTHAATLTPGPLVITATDAGGGSATVTIQVTAPATVSLDGTIVKAVANSTSAALTYSSGNSYTIAGGQIFKNGKVDARTSGVMSIGKLGTNLYQQNTFGNYYEIADVPGAGTWSLVTLANAGPYAPVVVVPPPNVSPDGTIIQAGSSAALTYPSGNAYIIVGGVIHRNGQASVGTNNVTAMAKQGTTLVQVNTAKNYYSATDTSGTMAWSGGGAIPIPPFPPLPVVVVPPVVTGPNFSMSGSKIFDPSGNVWFGRGVDVAPWGRPVYQNAPGPLLASFPGINLYGIYIASDEGFTVDTGLFSIIQVLTAQKVLVLLHSCNAAFTNNVPKGSDLTAECNMFAGYATQFKSNSYVGFVTSNEPSDAGTPGAVTVEHNAVYNAIRATGNGGIVGLSVANPGNPMDPSVYAKMKNTYWEQHRYPWEGQGQTGYSYITSFEPISSCPSRDGTMPLIIGECGPSTSGGDPLDGPWLPAEIMSTPPYTNLGSGMLLNGWSWWGVASAGSQDQLYPNNGTSGTLSPYGAQVAAGIAHPASLVSERRLGMAHVSLGPKVHLLGASSQQGARFAALPKL